MKVFFLILTAASFVFCASSANAEYYRYKNEKGQLVMEQSIPPQFVRQGYEVLSDGGRLIETVPPALTQEQIDTLDKDKAISIREVGCPVKGQCRTSFFLRSNMVRPYCISTTGKLNNPSIA